MSGLTYVVEHEQAARLAARRSEVSAVLGQRAPRSWFLLRMLQEGERLGLPESRPMPAIGSGCHELRVVDGDVTWRILYGLAADAVVILEVFSKKTRATPKTVLDVAKRRWKRYLQLVEGAS